MADDIEVIEIEDNRLANRDEEGEGDHRDDSVILLADSDDDGLDLRAERVFQLVRSDDSDITDDDDDVLNLSVVQLADSSDGNETGIDALRAIFQRPNSREDDEVGYIGGEPIIIPISDPEFELARRRVVDLSDSSDSSGDEEIELEEEDDNVVLHRARSEDEEEMELVDEVEEEVDADDAVNGFEAVMRDYVDSGDEELEEEVDTDDIGRQLEAVMQDLVDSDDDEDDEMELEEDPFEGDPFAELEDDDEEDVADRRAERRLAANLAALEELLWEELNLANLAALEELLWEEEDDVEIVHVDRGRGAAAAVTEGMIREAATLREKDASDPSSTRYSRACPICITENPRQRAVFSTCGHIVCYSCAVDNARSAATEGKCVFCRSESGFVKLFEDEQDSEKMNVEG